MATLKGADDEQWDWDGSPLGYVENHQVSLLSEGSRAIFDHAGGGLHVDVFYEKLDLCHVISWARRLELDAPTIPLAEMLLEKMQIVEINEKDVIDTIILLLQHPLGDSDRDTVNIERVAQLCAEDWGLWHTTTMNLDKVRQLAQGYDQLADEHKAYVAAQVAAVLARIEAEPEPLACRVKTPVTATARTMTEAGYRSVLVVDARGRPLGVVSGMDLLAFCEQDECKAGLGLASVKSPQINEARVDDGLAIGS